MKMLKAEKQKYKKLLLGFKEMLMTGMKHIEKDTLSASQREASGDLSSSTYHMADMATDTYDRDFSLNLATKEQRVLYEIEEALRRLDEDTYGICESCSKAITKQRLKAMPYARHCIKCQSKKEESGRK